METDYTIDTVGKFCPVPIIEAANKIMEMDVGKTLTVISDDSGILSDMKNWCSMTGNEFLGDTDDNGVLKVYVRKAVH